MSTNKARGVPLPGLRQARNAAGLSLKDLSRETGIDYTFLWKLEKGKAKAGYFTISSLTEKLSVGESTLKTCAAVA